MSGRLSGPHSQIGQKTQVIIDLAKRGGMLMIRFLISPRETAVR